MVRRFALMCALVLILSGCKAAAPPPIPAPTVPEPVTAAPAQVGPCLSQPHGDVYGGVLGWVVEQGTCTVAVASDDVWVGFSLPADVPVDVGRAALSVSGPVQPDVRVFDRGPWNDQLHFELHFPPGQPGERLEVRLAGPVGAGGVFVDMGFVLERVPTPGVSLEWRPDGGDWQPFPHVANLPRAAAELRFCLQGQVTRAVLESVLKEAGIPRGDWSDDGVTVRRLSDPPAHLLLNFDGIRNYDHLQTAHSVWEIFFGAPPQLVALDPASGTEEPVGEAPLNVAWSLLSPDGRWVALFAVHPDNPYAEEAWAMEIGTGRLIRLGTESPWPYLQAFWRADELLVTNGGRVFHWPVGSAAAVPVETRSAHFMAISPDGRYLAGYMYDWERESPDALAPGSIVLYDAASRTDRLVAVDQVNVRISHSEFPAHLQMRFTPDGAGLLIGEPVPGEGGSVRWVRLDLATEELSPVPEMAPVPASASLASPAGYEVPAPAGQYADAMVKAPDGSERSFGPGLVSGWLPDGRLLLVRWENGQYLRRVWSGE